MENLSQSTVESWATSLESGEFDMATNGGRVSIDYEAREGVREIRQRLEGHEKICELRQGNIISGLGELKATVNGMRNFGITQLIAAVTTCLGVIGFLFWYILTHPH